MAAPIDPTSIFNMEPKDLFFAITLALMTEVPAVLPDEWVRLVQIVIAVVFFAVWQTALYFNPALGQTKTTVNGLDRANGESL